MPYVSRSTSSYLNRAFRDGERFGQGTVHVVEADPLVLPTGRIVACDPTYLIFGGSREQAYTRTVAPGRYPVFLSLFVAPTFSWGEEVVACAMVRFRDEPCGRWEMALRPGWDRGTLRPGQIFGFGVDAGTACFADEQTLTQIPDDQPAYAAGLEARLYPDGPSDFHRLLVPPALGELFDSCHRLTTAGDGPRAVSGVIDPTTGGNVVCFLSGIGDGCYASYFGLAADGTAVCLVADFGVLKWAEPETLTLPVPSLVECSGELTGAQLAALGVDRIRFIWDPATEKLEVRIPGTAAINAVRLQNDARSSAGDAGFWVPFGDESRWLFRLAAPPPPTARLVIEYTPRTEAP